MGELTLNKSDIELELESGKTVTDEIIATKKNLSQSIRWTSSNPSVATVTESEETKAIVTAVSVGETTITATCNIGGEEYTQTCKVTVKKITVADVQDKVLSSTENTEVYDDEDNKIVVPAGFKITTDASKVSEGIVIQDEAGNEFVWIPVTELNTSGFNEPDVVTGDGSQYDAVEDNLKNAECTDLNNNGKIEADDLKIQLTNEFNGMAASVNKYHGFYVGRYETSFNGTTAQSKSGETPMNSINWYAMYKNSKTYAPENSTKAVVSQMIWGSQWKAMINYIKTTADASHATATNNVGHVSSDFTIKPYKTGGTNYTEAYKGSKAYNDKAANIYDLEGNVMEWTQEANDIDIRISMGGSYRYSFSPNVRHKDNPTDSGSVLGSRLALYIK